MQHEAKNASMATVILLVIAVDSIPPDFIQQILIHLTYSPQIVIAINKMETQNFAEAVYISTVEKITNLMKDIDLPSPPLIIPISTLNGDNITSKSAAMPWWLRSLDLNTNKKYDHLMDLIENYTRIPQRVPYSHTRITVNKEFPKMKVFEGYVINGCLKQNDTFFVMNNQLKDITFSSIRMNESSASEVLSREHFSAAVPNFELIKKGTLLFSRNDILTRHKQAHVIADIIIYQPKVKENTGCLLYSHSSSVDSKIRKIQYKIGPDNTKIETKELQFKDRARVTLTPSKPFTLDCAVNCKYLGSITGMLSGKVGFIGRIVDIELENGKYLSSAHKWSRVRLLLLSIKDRNALLPFPREIILLIAHFIWKGDYKETILYNDYY